MARDLFQLPERDSAAPSLFKANADAKQEPYILRAKAILRSLGILGEHGSQDILTLLRYIHEHDGAAELSLGQLCSLISDNPKSAEQRIRRTATTGLINLANLGLEDYSNDVFTEYANTLYNFEQVRKEMNCIRGKSIQHGNVKIKSFLNALLSYCQGTV